MADHNANLIATAPELYSVLVDVLDFYEACDVDAARDYCMTHHIKGCDGDAVYKLAHEIIVKARGESSAVKGDS